MQCQSCGYALFGLPEPRCPECNTPFDVLAYTFEPGTVQFGCPHCGQRYEGNDPRGLPDPTAFECVKCHQAVDASAMCVLPVVDGARGVHGPALRLPWEGRQEDGLIRPWLATCRLGMFSPMRYYRHLRDVDDLGKAIGFAALSAAVAGALGTLITAAISFAFEGLGTGPDGTPPPGKLAALQLGLQSLNILLSVPVELIVLFIFAGIVHLGVMMFARQRRGYACTVVALAYAMCPAMVGLIPFVGGYVYLPWRLIVGVAGVAVLHRTSTVRAVAACVVPVAILGLVIIALKQL